MTAGNVPDTLSRLTGMANNAVSANTQVKMMDASRLLELSQAECSAMRILRDRRLADRYKIDGPAVLLESNVYGGPLARLSWERKLEELFCKKMGKMLKVRMLLL